MSFMLYNSSYLSYLFVDLCNTVLMFCGYYRIFVPHFSLVDVLLLLI